MTDQTQWKRETSVRHVAAEQDGVDPPPLERSFAAAARYVGAETEEVRRWWQGRGEMRAVDPNQPPRCKACAGNGRVWRYRIDDHRFPVVCPGCDGSGVAC